MQRQATERWILELRPALGTDEPKLDWLDSEHVAAFHPWHGKQAAG